MTSLEDTIKRYDMMSQRIDRQFEPLKWLYENSALASVHREQAAITAALGTSLIARDYKTAYDLSCIPALERSRALSRRIQSITQSVKSEALSLAIPYKSASSSALSLYNSIGVNLEFLKSTVMPSSWLTQQVTDLATQVQNVCLRMEPTESCPPLRVEREISLDDETADLVMEVLTGSKKVGASKSEIWSTIKKKMPSKELVSLILSIVAPFLLNYCSNQSAEERQIRMERDNQTYYSSDLDCQRENGAALQKIADKLDLLSSQISSQNQHTSNDSNDTVQIPVNQIKRMIDRNNKEAQSDFSQDKTNFKPLD